MADLQKCQSDEVKKSKEVLDELKQLKTKVANFEREKSIYSHKVVNNLLLSLASEETKLDKKRHNESLELQRKIERIKLKVNAFKHLLSDTTRTNPSSVEKIKECLEDIENSINSFKDKQKETYEELLIQERLVWQEISAYKRQIEGWTTTTGGESHVTTRTGHVTLQNKEEEEEEEDDRQCSKAPKSIAAFQSFLYQKGGHTGGWEELDHNVFIKLWNKHKGAKESLLEEAIREIPSHSDDVILHHIKWYKEYIDLKESHRLAINEWRQQREVERKKTLTSEKRKKEKKGEELKEKKTAREKLKEKEREETKKKLEQWKQHQITLKLAEAEKDELRRRDEAIKEKRKQDRQAFIKRQAMEYSKTREEEKRKKELLEMIQIEEQKEKAKSANRHIQYFQQRDSLTLQAKQDHIASQEHQQEMKRIQLEKIKKSVAIKVERDPSRLLKPTSVWVERQKMADTEQSVGPMLTIPKRATPSWRQNI